MALFFDADWFDARLSEKGLDRAALAIAAGIERAELHRIFTNERAPTAEELSAFTTVLGADLVEVTLRSGVSSRDASAEAGAEGRHFPVPRDDPRHLARRRHNHERAGLRHRSRHGR